jgi:transposase InsO family protein
VFNNLVKDVSLAAPNQAWAAGITYIRTGGGFPCLALLMDLFSRKIAGYHAGDTPEAEVTVRALELALKDLPDAFFPPLIKTAAAGTARICMLKNSHPAGFR